MRGLILAILLSSVATHAMAQATPFQGGLAAGQSLAGTYVPGGGAAYSIASDYRQAGVTSGLDSANAATNHGQFGTAQTVGDAASRSITSGPGALAGGGALSQGLAVFTPQQFFPGASFYSPFGGK